MNAIHANIRNAFSQSVNSFLATQATIGNHKLINNISSATIFKLIKNKDEILSHLSDITILISGGLSLHTSLVPSIHYRSFNLLLRLRRIQRIYSILRYKI